MGDHAVEALRPLWQDIALLAVPVVVASLVGALGIVLRRLPRWLCVSVICVATIAFIAPLLSVAGWAPSWLGEIVATLGGVTTIEAFVAAHLLCIVWVAPKRSLSAPFLAILIVAALFVVVIDNMAALRWRLAHANPDDAVWSNRCDDDGVLAQRTGATCAPASGAMLLYRYGISVSEGAIAYRAGTSAFGTDEYELADGIQSMLGGTAGRAEATHETAEEVIAGGAPCIVYIDTPLGCHAVLLEAVVNGQLDLVDPLGGVRETISSEEFATVFRGVVIRIGGLPRRR
jgi:hypothetical protein